MLSRREDPFPTEAARDLLALARTIRHAKAAAGAGRYELERLRATEVELDQLIGLAVGSGPDTCGERAAWTRLLRVKHDVAVELTMPARELVRAAMARVLRSA